MLLSYILISTNIQETDLSILSVPAPEYSK